MYYIIQTREAFEGRLRTMQGLEFVVTHDPSENDSKPDHTGVWVIRKQHRRKKQGVQDEVTGISSYYVVGENVYMAPSVGNILSSRLVCAVLLLFTGPSNLNSSSRLSPPLQSYCPQRLPFPASLPRLAISIFLQYRRILRPAQAFRQLRLAKRAHLCREGVHHYRPHKKLPPAQKLLKVHQIWASTASTCWHSPMI